MPQKSVVGGASRTSAHLPSLKALGSREPPRRRGQQNDAVTERERWLISIATIAQKRLSFAAGWERTAGTAWG